MVSQFHATLYRIGTKIKYLKKTKTKNTAAKKNVNLYRNRYQSTNLAASMLVQYFL